MRSRSRGLVAVAASLCALALLVPSMASANHISYPIFGVGGTVVGNSGSKIVACTATASIGALPKTGNLLTGNVNATATSRCVGTQGLLRAFMQVRIYQGSTLLHYQECRFFSGVYPPNKTYTCKTPNVPFSGVGLLRAETNQAYRLPSGSWVAAISVGDCWKTGYPDDGLPPETGARCEVEVTTAA